MPVVAFKCPKCQRRVEFEDAVSHFSRTCPVGPSMYGPSVQALLNSVGDERRGLGAGVSASMSSPTVCCRRQVVMERTLPFELDPRVLMDAEEGTIFHKAFHDRAAGLAEFDVEVVLPNMTHEGRPGVRWNELGFWQLELWPGVWWSGVADLLSKDRTLLDDLKTKRPSATIYPPGEDNKAQLFTLCLAIERLEGKQVQEARIWQYQRGCYEKEKQQTPFVIARRGDPSKPFWTEQQLRQHCEEHLRTTSQWLDRAERIVREHGAGSPQLEELIAEVPMDGWTRKMFYSRKTDEIQKCTRYCSVRDLCMERAGVRL